MMTFILLLSFLAVGGNCQSTTTQTQTSKINANERCLCVQGSCDYGWVQYKNACYKRFNGIVSWPEAESTCLSYNSHLASIHSQEENDFIFVLMGKPVDPYNKGAYWIGVHDSFKEGQYMNSDGSIITMLPFGKGQPDNLGIENYVGSWYIEDGHITWNDYPLTPYVFPFVCKYYLGNRLCGNEEYN
ncbi:alpha-N-acetylgalactosamine-specific lectin-like isoform X2 [Lissotriton helveticus]